MDATPDPTLAFAVTTRSRLKSARFFFPMLTANAAISRQLRDTPGAVGFASVVAGPREFWTISLWRSRDDMQRFMRSGAHEHFLWRISRWFDSFWLMRWASAEGERAADEIPSHDPGTAAEVLVGIPMLLASFHESGRPTYQGAPNVREGRERVRGIAGSVIRISPRSAFGVVPAWRRARQIERTLRSGTGVLRTSSGLSGRDAYVLAVCSNEAASQTLASHPLVADTLGRRGGEASLTRWCAENEFGQWDGLRMRRVRPSVKQGEPAATGPS